LNETTYSTAFKEFRNDLKTVIKKDETVFVIKCAEENMEEFNIHVGGMPNQDSFHFEDCTFKNKEKLELFYDKLKHNFYQKGLNYRFVKHKYYDDVQPQSLHYYIWNKIKQDVITLYISPDILEWSNEETYKLNIEILGNTIKETFL
jgi:hypothetical protein